VRHKKEGRNKNEREVQISTPNQRGLSVEFSVDPQLPVASLALSHHWLEIIRIRRKQVLLMVFWCPIIIVHRHKIEIAESSKLESQLG
jgi:hypothetical protein